ncbi:unnamed protein product [Closterium sp. NIES-53]
MPPPLAPAVLAAVTIPVQSAPVADLSAPAVAAVPLAPPAEPPVFVPAVNVVDPPVPVPVAPVAPPAAVPLVPALAAALSPQAVSATTGSPGPGDSRGPAAPGLPASSAAAPPAQRPPSPGGPVTAQYPSLLPVGRAPPVATPQVQPLVGPLPSAEVPEASLGKLWRLSEGLRAVHLIQVYGHAALSQGVSLDGGPRDECLDAADRLAKILAPVLAAPARGGVAGVGQLGTTLRGLRRFLRARTAVNLIGTATVVVRELHRSLTGLLAILDADQM